MGKSFCSHGLKFKDMVKFFRVLIICYGVVNGKTVSRQKVLEVERRINRISRHAVKSIQVLLFLLTLPSFYFSSIVSMIC